MGKQFSLYLSAMLVGAGVMYFLPNLEVDGFTKLGSDAPSIKMKKFTGLTGVNETEPFPMSGLATIFHGLDRDKIISVNASVNAAEGAGNVIPDEYSPDGSTGWLYHVLWDESRILLINDMNSVHVNGKPYIVTVIYEE